MPKGPRGEKRPADVISAAIKVARIAVGEEEERLAPTPGETMSELAFIIQNLDDTNAMLAQLDSQIAEHPDDEILRINADAVRKRHTDLARRLDAQLRANHQQSYAGLKAGRSAGNQTHKPE